MCNHVIRACKVSHIEPGCLFCCQCSAGSDTSLSLAALFPPFLFFFTPFRFSIASCWWLTCLSALTWFPVTLLLRCKGNFECQLSVSSIWCCHCKDHLLFLQARVQHTVFEMCWNVTSRSKELQIPYTHFLIYNNNWNHWHKCYLSGNLKDSMSSPVFSWGCTTVSSDPSCSTVPPVASTRRSLSQTDQN